MSYQEKRKVRTGQVVSDRMDKTVVVEVRRIGSHPRYKKLVRHVKKYKVHDENKICKVGDEVKIVETRPLSREKRWRVVEVISKATGATPEVTPEAAQEVTPETAKDDSDLHQT